MARILFLHTSAVLGGSERAFLDLYDGLPKAIREGALVILPADGPLAIALESRGASFRVIPFPKRFARATRKMPWRSLLWAISDLAGLTRYCREVRSLMRVQGIRLVYSNGIKSHLLASIFAPPRTHWILHLQDYFPSFGFVRAFADFFGRRPNWIVANSEDVRRDLVTFGPRRWRTLEIAVSPNAVDLTRFVRPSVAIPVSRPVRIAMVGILTPWKGQALFLDALACLRERRPDLKFEASIVGDEIYRTAGESGFRAELQRRCARLGLESVVEFRGFIEEIETVYREIDIVCHCSITREPFGKVIVEAMASECMVIASRCGGAAEIFEHEREGLYFEPNSVESLFLMLERACGDEALRRRLALAGRQRAERDYGSQLFVESILPKIERLSA